MNVMKTWLVHDNNNEKQALLGNYILGTRPRRRPVRYFVIISSPSTFSVSRFFRIQTYFSPLSGGYHDLPRSYQNYFQSHKAILHIPTPSPVPEPARKNKIKIHKETAQRSARYLLFLATLLADSRVLSRRSGWNNLGIWVDYFCQFYQAISRPHITLMVEKSSIGQYYHAGVGSDI